MKKIITEVKCDVCKKEMKDRETELTVVFTTEQTEGRNCTPYLSKEKINICDDCLRKILYEGKQLFGYGAQGCNEYEFKE